MTHNLKKTNVEIEGRLSLGKAKKDDPTDNVLKGSQNNKISNGLWNLCIKNHYKKTVIL